MHWLLAAPTIISLVAADPTIISSDGTLIWNLTEISPNGKVKEIPVEKWGKKYDPLRVWCCIPALLEFERLAIIQQTWGKYCDKLLFFIGDNTQKEIEVVDVTQKLANGSDYTLYNVVKLKLERTGDGLERDAFEKMWKIHQFLYVYHKDDYDWMIRADMDAWFSTPNFKGHAQYFDPSLDWAFGKVAFHEWKSKNYVFNFGGCNALSRGTINKLNRIYLTAEFLNPVPRGPKCQICQNIQCWWEDNADGACLKSIGIFPTNTLDTSFRARWSNVKKSTTYSSGSNHEYSFEGQTVGEDCCTEHFIAFHWYKDITTLFDDYSKLDTMYSEKSKNNWMSHPCPPKPVTFLMSVSINDEFVDEYFNIESPPNGQKIWKGVDNLWNYLDSEHPTLHQTLHPKLQPTPTTAPTLFKNREVDISISAFVGLFIIMIVFGFNQARFIDWMCCRRNAAVNTVPFY